MRHGSSLGEGTKKGAHEAILGTVARPVYFGYADDGQLQAAIVLPRQGQGFQAGQGPAFPGHRVGRHVFCRAVRFRREDFSPGEEDDLTCMTFFC